MSFISFSCVLPIMITGYKVRMKYKNTFITLQLHVIDLKRIRSEAGANAGSHRGVVMDVCVASLEILTK